MSGIARTPGQLSRIGRPLTSLSDANFAPLEEQVVQLASGEDLQARGEIVEGYDSEEATTEELFTSGQASETNLADSPISKYLCPLRIIIHFLPRPSVIYPHDSSFDGGKGFALVCAPELLNYTRWPIGTFFRLYVEGPPPLIDYTPLFGSNWTPILAVDHRRTKYYTESGTGRINVAIFLKPWPWAVSSVNIRIARAFRDADQDIRNVYLGWPAKRWKELYTSTVRDLQVNGAQELLLDERGEAKIAPNLLF